MSNVAEYEKQQSTQNILDTLIQWVALVTIVASLLLATFTKSILTLKPVEFLLIFLIMMLLLRRVLRKDFSYHVTLIDAAFLLLILGGTVIPFTTLEYRSIYMTKDIFRNLIAPLFYYAWYRAFLEALPMPLHVRTTYRVLLATLALVCVYGILQFLHFPYTNTILLKYYQVDPYLLKTVHRAVSVVGDWESVGALSTYPIVILMQLYISRLSDDVLGKHWKILTVVLLGIFGLALIMSFSVGGVVALLTGIIVLVAINPSLHKIPTKYIGVGSVILLLVVGYVVYKKLLGPGHNFTIPVSWLNRWDNWRIVYAATSAKLSTSIFGVQPSFTYPASTLDSADNMYILYYYRGGLIFVASYIGFIGMTIRTLLRFWQRARTSEQGIILVTLTIFIINSVLGIFDPHFSYAAESHVVLTMLAIATGIALRTEKQISHASLHEVRNTLSLPLVRTVLLIGLTAAVIGAGAAWKYNKTLPPTPPQLQVQLFSFDTAISRENNLIGTFDWQLDPNADTTFIQGYAGVVSVNHGQNVPLYISSQGPVTYSLQVYRLGWYRGWGGRLVYSVDNLQSSDQGYWTQQSGLQNCSSCEIDPTTHLTDAHWQQSYVLPTTSQWVSGAYVVKIVSSHNGHPAESYIPFVVRDDQATSAFLVNIPMNTWEAANGWGGYSFFGHNDPSPYQVQQDRAYAVSFNRPYTRSAGAGELLNYDIHLIRWLERSNYDVTYTTDVDISQNPSVMLNYSGIITTGRDPYWSQSFYNGILQAVQKNVYMLYFGAQNGEWQARYAPDQQENANRTLISYQVSSQATSAVDALQRDPLLTKDPHLVTARWTDPFLHAPQLPFKLTGGGYLPLNASNPILTINNSPSISQIVTLNTGLVPGMPVLDGIVGPIYDGVTDLNALPIGYQVFAQATINTSSSDINYVIIGMYISPTGVVIFDAGTMRFVWALDDFTAPYADEPNTIQGNQHLSDMASNVLRVACHCGN